MRHEGEEQVALLNELYDQLRLFVNFFLPSMKFIEKVRQGSKVKKRYDEPKTPCQRLNHCRLKRSIVKHHHHRKRLEFPMNRI